VAADDTDADASGAPTLSVEAVSPRDARRRIVPGDRIGRYRVTRRIGAGGMGLVYLARDPQLDRDVAIKLLRPEVAQSKTRLLREGQAAARLNHPNVVSVYDVGSLGDDLFIAMEYVPGTTLGAWLGAAPRRWRDVLDRYRAAGRGLAAAHRAGIVHRDFKPENVLLADDGRVLVTDFGLAHADDAPRPGGAEIGEDVTRTIGVVGTPAYMSPEQFRADPVDARSDQFSFCLALWEGLYGERPFEVISGATTVEALADAVLAGRIRPPPRRRAPGRIERALRRGLANDPAARFPAMEALLTALTPHDRRRVVAAVAAGALAITALGIILFPAADAPTCVIDPGRIDALWSPAARRAYVTGADPAQLADDARGFDRFAARWKATARDVCARGRDRARPAACLADALRDLENALARADRSFWPEIADPRACADAATPKTHELRSQLGSIDPSGAIAPDGGLAAFSGGRILQALIDRDGTPVRPEVVTGVGRIFAWTDDGALIARAGDAIVRIDVATGARTRLPWPADLRAISPDVALAARVQNGEVVVVDRDGALRARAAAPGEDHAVVFAPDGRRAAFIGNDGGWYLVVVDLRTGRHTRTALRVHGDAGGTIAVAWPRPGQLVLSGAARRRDDEALWLAELTDEGGLVAPPTILVPPRSRTIMDLLHVRGDRALVVMVDVPQQHYRWRDGRATLLPGLLEGRVRSADAARAQLVIVDEDDAVAIDVAGAIVGRGSSVDGVDPILRGGALWFGRREGGALVLAGPGEQRLSGAPDGELVHLRCGVAGGCYARWQVADGARYTVLGDRALGAAFTLAGPPVDLDITRDGRRALAMFHDRVVEHDLVAGTSRVLHRESPECEVHRARWTVSARAFVYFATCGPERHLRIQVAAPGATPRTVTTIHAYPHGLEPLGEDDFVYSVVDYQSRLVMIDGLPF
jgi:predicted Ser/Thr protein kinase